MHPQKYISWFNFFHFILIIFSNFQFVWIIYEWTANSSLDVGLFGLITYIWIITAWTLNFGLCDNPHIDGLLFFLHDDDVIVSWFCLLKRRRWNTWISSRMSRWSLPPKTRAALRENTSLVSIDYSRHVESLKKPRFKAFKPGFFGKIISFKEQQVS